MPYFSIDAHVIDGEDNGVKGAYKVESLDKLLSLILVKVASPDLPEVIPGNPASQHGGLASDVYIILTYPDYDDRDTVRQHVASKIQEVLVKRPEDPAKRKVWDLIQKNLRD